MALCIQHQEKNMHNELKPSQELCSLKSLFFFLFLKMNSRKAAFFKCVPNEMYGSGWITLSMTNIVDGRWLHCNMHTAILMWFKTMTNFNHYAVCLHRETLYEIKWQNRNEKTRKELQENRSGLNWMLYIVHCIASVLIFLLFFSIAICKRFTIITMRSVKERVQWAILPFSQLIW